MQVAIEIDYLEGDESNVPIIKNASATIISGYSSKELGEGIEKRIDKDSLNTTDEWSAYPGAVDERWHLLFLLNGGANFRKLHGHTFNIKDWIRGIHPKILLTTFNDI